MTEQNSITKTCTKCSAEKPLDYFYRDKGKKDGRSSHCKNCIKVYCQSPRRKAELNVWTQSPKGKESQRIRNQKVTAKYPEKYIARTTMNNAIRGSKIIRPNSCSSCGVECTPHGHHEDYTKPLDVIWLCRPCHVARHL